MGQNYSFRNPSDFRGPRRLRLIIYQTVILVSFILLGVRIYQVQFVERETYVQQANENRFDRISVPAPRGIIVDRNGVPLAVNVPSFNVTVTPAFLPATEDETLRVLERLSGLIGVPVSGGVTFDEKGFPQRSLQELITEGQGIAPYRAVVVKTDVDERIARIILAEKLTLLGVDVDEIAVRHYPTGPLTAQLIGYMGPIGDDPESTADDDIVQEYLERGYVLDRDRVGYDGIEFTQENWLSGNPGLQTVVRDVAGQIVQTIGTTRPVQPGYSVTLTIDTELQAAAQEALEEEIEFLNTYYNKEITQRGAVIATNPQTGEVLAMVSWPTYDNERFARKIDYPYYLKVSQDPLHPLFNQAVGSLYPPGSVFKVLTLTAVLEEGVVTPDDLLFDPGHIELVNRYYPNDPGRSQRFVCWIERSTEKGHDYVDARHAIAWSCDVYFYKVGGGFGEEVSGLGLNIARLGIWMELFGLGGPTGIELPGDQTIEALAVIPGPDWKRQVWGENWSTGDTYNSAFGQGYVTVTPMQMLEVMNRIINDGKIIQPTLVREFIDSEGHVVQSFQPNVVGDMRDDIAAYWPTYTDHQGQQYANTLSQSMQVVRDGMRQAVTIEGATALNANLPYVQVAGKTGTAEYCDNEAAAKDLCKPGAWPSHAWFMGYAPYQNPEISVIAFVYNGGEGALVAGPVATAVMDAYFQLKARRAALGGQPTQPPAAAVTVTPSGAGIPVPTASDGPGDLPPSGPVPTATSP